MTLEAYSETPADGPLKERMAIDWGLVAIIERRGFKSFGWGCTLHFTGGLKVHFPPEEMTYEEALERKRLVGPTAAEFEAEISS